MRIFSNTLQTIGTYTSVLEESRILKISHNQSVGTVGVKLKSKITLSFIVQIKIKVFEILI